MSLLVDIAPTQESEWGRLKGCLWAALERAGNTHTLDDIWEGIRHDRFQFWPGPQSAVVTEVVPYPRLKALRFFLAAGDMDELKAMEQPIIEWGKRHGCTRVEICGRPGWERVLDGYRKTAVWLTKDL